MKQITKTVLHVDGVTKVTVKGRIINGEFVGEYRLDKMTWGVTIPVEPQTCYQVSTLLFPDTVLFKASTDWECRDFIEKKYGNGFAALLCQIKKAELALD